MSSRALRRLAAYVIAKRFMSVHVGAFAYGIVWLCAINVSIESRIVKKLI